jgi:hypothetical protein
MAVTSAEKQRRYRERLSEREQYPRDAIEAELLQEVERAERDELTAEACAALANKLADMAMRHLWRGQELAKLAQRVRPPGWNPPDAPGR